jgi:UDP-N-acetylglucosamine 2-epimerase (non-hydrolysing)
MTTSPLKLILVFGTRPEAIKMAPLYHELKKYPNEFETLVCVTAQHREMLDQVLNTFEIIPDIDLNLMMPGQDLFDLTSSVLLGMRKVLTVHNPNLILVHGDTTTSFAAALAGFYQGIPVGHVEAGLRTYDISAPFPEEFNRQVVSRIASINFSPTALSAEHLKAEKVKENLIVVTGNTVIDSLFWTLNRIELDSKRKQITESFLNSILNFDWKKNKFILITGHRRENFGNGFLQICNALSDLAQEYPKVHFVYPTHLNPQVQKPVNAILNNLLNVHLLPPLKYEPFLYLLKHCYLVLTDSGGIQEEAPSLGKPVLVMRNVTERPEAISAGTVRLVGANRDQIVMNTKDLLDNSDKYELMSKAHNPYGDGTACKRIVSALRKFG